MSEEINKDSVENEDSVVKIQDASTVSENNSIETTPRTERKVSYIHKKTFLYPLKANRFLLVRILYYILRSIWIVVMIVGGFLAWLLSMLFI